MILTFQYGKKMHSQKIKYVEYIFQPETLINLQL